MENDLKLLLKKAIFAGKTLLRHSESIASVIDDVSDKDLIKAFESDEQLSSLLTEWEELRETLGINP